MDAMLDDSNRSVGAAVKSPILSDPDKTTKQVVRGIHRAGTPTNLKPFANDINAVFAKNRDALYGRGIALATSRTVT